MMLHLKMISEMAVTKPYLETMLGAWLDMSALGDKIIIRTASRENLSSRFPTKSNANRPYSHKRWQEP